VLVDDGAALDTVLFSTGVSFAAGSTLVVLAAGSTLLVLAAGALSFVDESVEVTAGGLASFAGDLSFFSHEDKVNARERIAILFNKVFIKIFLLVNWLI